MLRPAGCDVLWDGISCTLWPFPRNEIFSTLTPTRQQWSCTTEKQQESKKHNSVLTQNTHIIKLSLLKKRECTVRWDKSLRLFFYSCSCCVFFSAEMMEIDCRLKIHQYSCSVLYDSQIDYHLYKKQQKFNQYNSLVNINWQRSHYFDFCACKLL